MKMMYVVGVVLMLIGVYQIYNTRSYFINLKTNGGKSTSPFIAYALYSSLVIGGFLIFIGFGTLFFFNW